MSKSNSSVDVDLSIVYTILVHLSNVSAFGNLVTVLENRFFLCISSMRSPAHLSPYGRIMIIRSENAQSTT